MANGIDYAIRIASRLMQHIDDRMPPRPLVYRGQPADSRGDHIFFVGAALEGSTIRIQ